MLSQYGINLVSNVFVPLGKAHAQLESIPGSISSHLNIIARKGHVWLATASAAKHRYLSEHDTHLA